MRSKSRCRCSGWQHRSNWKRCCRLYCLTPARRQCCRKAQQSVRPPGNRRCRTPPGRSPARRRVPPLFFLRVRLLSLPGRPRPLQASRRPKRRLPFVRLLPYALEQFPVCPGADGRRFARAPARAGASAACRGQHQSQRQQGGESTFFALLMIEQSSLKHKMMDPQSWYQHRRLIAREHQAGSSPPEGGCKTALPDLAGRQAALKNCRALGQISSFVPVFEAGNALS